MQVRTTPLPDNHRYQLVQNDVWHTPLPNGSPRWFDFERVELPDEPVLRGEVPPQWVANGPRLICRSSVTDAKITIEIDEFDETELQNDVESVEATPSYFRVSINAHGMRESEIFTCWTWQEVQARCAHALEALDENYLQLHGPCRDAYDNPTAEAYRSYECPDAVRHHRRCPTGTTSTGIAPPCYHAITREAP